MFCNKSRRLPWYDVSLYIYSDHILHIQSYMHVYKLWSLDILNTGFFCTSPLCQIASMATRDTHTTNYPVNSAEVTAEARKLIETGDWHPRSNTHTRMPMHPNAHNTQQFVPLSTLALLTFTTTISFMRLPQQVADSSNEHVDSVI
jgi:hypothetical protein